MDEYLLYVMAHIVAITSNEARHTAVHPCHVFPYLDVKRQAEQAGDQHEERDAPTGRGMGVLDCSGVQSCPNTNIIDLCVSVGDVELSASKPCGSLLKLIMKCLRDYWMYEPCHSGWKLRKTSSHPCVHQGNWRRTTACEAKP